MTADAKNVSQDDYGRHFHKAVFYDKQKNAMIGCSPIFEEQGGCWSCMTEIYMGEKKFVLQGMHDKHKILIYLEAV